MGRARVKNHTKQRMTTLKIRMDARVPFLSSLSFSLDCFLVAGSVSFSFFFSLPSFLTNRYVLFSFLLVLLVRDPDPDPTSDAL